jgi:O-antigen ligase
LKLSSRIDSIRDRLLNAGRWSLVVCLFVVPINKPATNIFLFLALIGAVAGSETRRRFLEAARHPVALGAMVWFLILFAGILIAPAGPEQWDELGVFKVLLYPLIVMSLADTQQWRTRALYAFGLATCLIVLVSWGQFLYDFFRNQLADADAYTVFKNYTQEGIAFLALAAMAAAFGHAETDRRRKFFFWGIALVATGAVIFILQSRTAYMIVASLLFYWVWQLTGAGKSWRKAAVGVLVLLVFAAAALSSPRLLERVRQAQEDVATLQVDTQKPTSLGVRYQLWKNTLPVIQAAPWFGHGLGQWRTQYDLAAERTGSHATRFGMGHPHQEVLLILTEQGWVGLAVTILMFGLLIGYMRRLDPPYGDFYLCLVLIYLTAGLTNCVLIDFSHRHVLIMLLALMPLAAARNTNHRQS